MCHQQHLLPLLLLTTILAISASANHNHNLKPDSFNTLLPSEAETLFKIMDSVSSEQQWRSAYPDPCNSHWPGIECKQGADAHPHVTRLDFGTRPNPSCDPNATFPHLIFHLPGLQSVFFIHCFLRTRTVITLPRLFNSSLQQLSLRSNPALLGSIPSQLSRITSLQSFDYPTANLSTTWTNHVSAPHSITFTDGSTIRAILLRGVFGPKYACGFYCNGSCDKYLFAVFVVQTNSGGGIVQPAIGFPQVVWSANRNYPVSLNSTLQLTSEGDLVLRDVDGVTAWSTNTYGKSVVGMNMTEVGNLVLFNSKNETVWQSFDHPTDALVPGQKLLESQSLTSSTSSSNWTQGVFSLSVSSSGLFAAIESDPPQVYYQAPVRGNKTSSGPSYIKLMNGSLALFILDEEPNDPNDKLSIPLASSAQYMKLEGDGHLRVYEWGKGDRGGWGAVEDLLTGYLGVCNYPMVCGEYGVCLNGQCSCPAATRNGTRLFEQIDDRQPASGCRPTSQLSCEASQYHQFLELSDATYFSFVSDLESTDMETCKEACLRNCSCKAALFRYGSNSTNGDCYLPSHIFSLMNNEKELTHYNSTAFIKVQGIPPTAPPASVRKKSSSRVIIGASVGGFAGLFLLAALVFLVVGRKRKDDGDEDEEEYLDQVPGMPTRFSYEELRIATEDFSRKLGEGGFGSVFEGKLGDGSEIAVKLLDGVGQIRNSFLAEVETIGSVHHVNLVKLVGFCAEKSHRALVYEYMPNGSLEKWIFKPKAENVLDWRQRKKIILDIAKGLSYLHEDCRQKIVHLDIKPQNILLDERFNAKVSDFGLSKLIDKDQSNVMTTMRGTPGYLAPEWLNSVITEKVDVYSFGVVVLEILCGRKNLDRSQPEDEMHLLSLFKSKAEENLLLDLVDTCSPDMKLHGEEVVEMMRVATWCLQSDFAKRPSMSVVVKVLEGVMDVDKSVDYTFLAHTEFLKTATKLDDSDGNYAPSTTLIPSVLSGPR
uniref:non-specific serine/threonine protein kinase n=1 Tax=Kalanchoe fedtschenkoi TaxID=63787 RepID=A0A7N0T362_KALFE